MLTLYVMLFMSLLNNTYITVVQAAVASGATAVNWTYLKGYLAQLYTTYTTSSPSTSTSSTLSTGHTSTSTATTTASVIRPYIPTFIAKLVYPSDHASVAKGHNSDGCTSSDVLQQSIRCGVCHSDSPEVRCYICFIFLYLNVICAYNMNILVCNYTAPSLTPYLLYYVQMAYQSKCGHIFCYICIIPLISHTRNNIIAKPVGTGGTVGKVDKMVKISGSASCPVCAELVRGVKRWDGRQGRS